MVKHTSQRIRSGPRITACDSCRRRKIKCYHNSPNAVQHLRYPSTRDVTRLNSEEKSELLRVANLQMGPRSASYVIPARKNAPKACRECRKSHRRCTHNFHNGITWRPRPPPLPKCLRPCQDCSKSKSQYEHTFRESVTEEAAMTPHFQPFRYLRFPLGVYKHISQLVLVHNGDVNFSTKSSISERHLIPKSATT